MARGSSLRSFFRRSQQDRVVEESPPVKGFGDITDGTSNTLVVGEQAAAVAEPSTEEFDEADALFGRRTEIRDTEPAKTPDPESSPDEISHASEAPLVVPELPPTPPGVPIPYPNTARSEEDEELQQLVKADTGPSELDASVLDSGASNDAVETSDPGPVLENSPTTDPTLVDLSTPDVADIGRETVADFNDPVGDALDDPFEAGHSDDASVFEEGVGIEEGFDEPTGDLDFEPG